jgi:hypothetical protein
MKLKLLAVGAAALACTGFAPVTGVLLVFNGSQVPAMISIDGNPAKSAQPGKPVSETVRPGSHKVVVTRRSATSQGSFTLTAANAYAGGSKPTWCVSARTSGITLETPTTCHQIMSGG